MDRHRDELPSLADTVQRSSASCAQCAFERQDLDSVDRIRPETRRRTFSCVPVARSCCSRSPAEKSVREYAWPISDCPASKSAGSGQLLSHFLVDLPKLGSARRGSSKDPQKLVMPGVLAKILDRGREPFAIKKQFRRDFHPALTSNSQIRFNRGSIDECRRQRMAKFELRKQLM